MDVLERHTVQLPNSKDFTDGQNQKPDGAIQGSRARRAMQRQVTDAAGCKQREMAKARHNPKLPLLLQLDPPTDALRRSVLAGA